MIRRTLLAALLAIIVVTPAGATDRVTGIASWYDGTHAAANWCTWPWTDCGSLEVHSLDTGLTIIVPVRMFCDCFTGTPDERLVDLTRNQVLALGLNPADGLFAVTVRRTNQTASSAVLPDTAVSR